MSFGNDSSEYSDEERRYRMEQQALINEQNAEISQKKSDLYKERLNILTSQRGQTWYTPPIRPVKPSSPARLPSKKSKGAASQSQRRASQQGIVNELLGR